MSENVIFCYSGTGNCLDMAKTIARELGDTDIILMRREPAVTDVRDAKRVGFVFPCYGGGLPGGVEESLRKIRVGLTAYTFGVCQYAGYMGSGLHKLNSIIPLTYWAGVSHQCSCIWLFPHTLMMPPISPEKAQKRSEEKAMQIAIDALSFKRRKQPPKMSVNAVESAAWPLLSKLKGRKLKASDACIGCGQCAKLCPKGKVQGIDYSAVSVEKARKVNARAIAAGRCNVQQASVTELPFEAEQFDVATAFETVYFWPELAQNFREVYRVLKPGGIFFICNEANGETAKDDKWTQIINGMTIYTDTALKAYLEQAGFCKIQNHKNKKGWLCVTAQK